MYFSIIVPVFNRPDEICLFLDSIKLQVYEQDFEVIIVEDGSTLSCKTVIEDFKNDIDIQYFYKPNSGPGDSRNYGMRRAKGDYFLIFDSDCELPSHYFQTVASALQSNFVDCFGGPDAALSNYSNIQKAINFAMTSFLTTGGIRGGSEKLDKFQPRSFNMGISKNAFLKSGGFRNIHPGEDPDLSIRLWNLGFKTKLIKNAFVYHRRRIDWKKFYTQVNKFGIARPILDFWHPGFRTFIFTFPSLFLIVFSVAIVLFSIGYSFFIKCFFFYFLLIFFASLVQNQSLQVAILSVFAVAIQFFGYGMGYLKSFFFIFILKNKPESAFPNLFFKQNEN
jgi:glycosyltransferase involved in cell wall biosynthesis